MSDDELGRVATAYMALFPAVYLRFHRRDGKRRELTGAAQAVLLHLAQTGPLTIGEAAHHFGRSQSATSEIMKQLEKKGLLARVRDENDARRSLIWLTERARKRLSDEREVLSREHLLAALEQMKPAERAMLLESTRSLVEAADRGHGSKKKASKR